MPGLRLHLKAHLTKPTHIPNTGRSKAREEFPSPGKSPMITRIQFWRKPSFVYLVQNKVIMKFKTSITC